GLAEIAWDDITEYAPAVVAAVTMPLTYSIATGIGLGFMTYAAAKLIAGKFAEAKPAVVALAVLFALKFAVSGLGTRCAACVRASTLAAACHRSRSQNQGREAMRQASMPAVLVVVAGLAVSTCGASAQDNANLQSPKNESALTGYPTKPIRLIAPEVPGSAT